MAKRKGSRKTKAKRIAGKKRKVKMKMHGLQIPIPPELDLPAGAPFEGRPQPGTMQIPKDIQEMFGPLIEMATNAWRLKVRMTDPDSGEPKEETHKLYRFVEGLFRALGDAGIQVIDKTGKPYDNGMSEKVISFEQTPGLLKEEIIDTVRPAIRWKERQLYHGEIIVGIPVIETPPEEAPEAETISVPSETASDSTQPAEAAESPPDQSDGPPDPGPDQSEAVISGGPSEQEAISDVAEDESASTAPEDTQEQESLAAPKTPAQPETPDQTEKE